MQRIIGVLAGALIPLISLPLAAAAAEHSRPVDRSAASAYAPRPVAHEYARRPAVREYAPRRVVREYAPRPIVREYAPRPAERERFAKLRMAPRFEQQRRSVFERRSYAPRAEVRERFERRNNFVRYYSPRYFAVERTPRRVVFHRYIPERVFVAPPVEIVRTYAAGPTYYDGAALPVSYVYSGYMPIYGSQPTITPMYYSAPVEMPLPIGYDPYPQNPYATQYPYPNQYGYGGAPFAINPFGNAQLQGIVISNTGNGIVVLTPDLQPVFVNTAVAQQNGYVQGNISPGSFVNVFGYNTGNEFIATALG
ncbi:MAG: hypothetical protein JO322_06890 [Candidatus Eremiobacteraeota bacterium]|nr:hypothetical protein [Candidatus Eremiobacteraeota bacterium]